jgi:uncharacterized membrane protein
MNMSKLLASAITAAVALPALSLAAPPAPVPTFTFEKCYGVAARGSNDCGAGAHGHGCAGETTKAKDPESWIYVPAGTCKKIDGGTTKS